MAIKTPRDRDASFAPRLVAKRQTRLAGLDDKILAMYAGGMTVREIEAQLSELYGVQIGRDTISRVTDAVLADVQAWRTRPLDEIYTIVYLDCLTVKVREDRSVQNRACYLAIGVTLEGTREVLGIWWRDSEGAKFWLAVLNDLHQRGVRDVLICCVDGLEGFPEAIEAVFPQAWVQTCVVHQVRNSMRYVSYRDRKTLAAALRPIYTAANADDARLALARFDEQWGAKYPMITASWRERWEHIIPFLVAARRPQKGGLHHQQHREPQPPDPQDDQDPRQLPRRAGRDQADLPRHPQGPALVGEGLQLARRDPSPQDPLPRQNPRLIKCDNCH